MTSRLFPLFLALAAFAAPLPGCRPPDTSQSSDASTSIALSFARKVDALAKIRAHMHAYSTARDVDLLGAGGIVAGVRSVAGTALAIDEGWKALDELILAASRSGATTLQTELLLAFRNQRDKLDTLVSTSDATIAHIESVEKILTTIPPITYDIGAFASQYEQMQTATANTLALLAAIKASLRATTTKNVQIAPHLFDISRTRAKAALLDSGIANAQSAAAALDQDLQAETAFAPMLAGLRSLKSSLEASLSARRPFSILARGADLDARCDAAERLVDRSPYDAGTKSEYLGATRTICDAARSVVSGVAAYSEANLKNVAAIGHERRSRKLLALCQGATVPAIPCDAVAWLSTLSADSVRAMSLPELQALEARWDQIETQSTTTEAAQ
jgi:hypothetical protein